MTSATKIKVSAWPEMATVDAGETTAISVVVTNTSAVIDAYTVEVLGADPEWIEAEPGQFSLFPGETQNVELGLSLPPNYPASQRTLTVHVHSENDANAFELVHVQLDIRPATRTSIEIDPAQTTGGKSARYGLIVSNDGNAPVTASAFAVDPEELAAFEFEPPVVVVPPGRSQVIQVMASGGRSWFGQPRARLFTVGVEAEQPVESLATFVQRPRIPRWSMSLLGLLMAAAVFAAVLAKTFDRVVEEASVGDEVIETALASGEAGGAIVPNDPGTLTGKLTTSGNEIDAAPIGFRAVAAGENDDTQGIPAVQVELFPVDDVMTPVASAATDSDGAFVFHNLSAGEYLLRLTGAGYDEVWFSADGPAVTGPADATAVEVKLGAETPIGEVQIGGIPVTVGGAVGGDAGGATLRLVRPGVLDENVPAVVAEIEIGPDGSFDLPDIPTPADYTIIVEKPGFAPETRDITLRPGEELPDIKLELSPAEGRGEGLVVDVRGTALGGISVLATDGTHTISTVSYTEGSPGRFVLRNLSTPGRYTVTASGDGYVSESQSLVLAPGQTDAPSLTMVMIPATGEIQGTAFLEGQPSGDITIDLTGVDTERSTQPISVGAAPGAYYFSGLASPGTYTLKISGGGALPQVRVVRLDPLGGLDTGVVPLVDLRLKNRTVSGTVIVQGEVLANEPTRLVLTDGTERRELLADDATGAFAFPDVPPGPYTLTATRRGADPTVVLVTVAAGIDPPAETLRLAELASITGRVLLGGSDCGGLVMRLYENDKFDEEPTQVAVLAGENYRFLGVKAPLGYLVAVYDAQSGDPKATTSVVTKPSSNSEVDDIDLRLTCAGAGSAGSL